MLVIEQANRWPSERVEAFSASIIGLLQKLVDQFPLDETVEHLLHVATNNQLWVAYDTNDYPYRALMVVMSRIATVPVTGQRLLEFTIIGDDRFEEAAPLVTEVEEWAAREHGITRYRGLGRPGFGKHIKHLGYRCRAETLEKQREAT